MTRENNKNNSQQLFQRQVPIHVPYLRGEYTCFSVVGTSANGLKNFPIFSNQQNIW